MSFTITTMERGQCCPEKVDLIIITLVLGKMPIHFFITITKGCFWKLQPLLERGLRLGGFRPPCSPRELCKPLCLQVRSSSSPLYLTILMITMMIIAKWIKMIKNTQEKGLFRGHQVLLQVWLPLVKSKSWNFVFQTTLNPDAAMKSRVIECHHNHQVEQRQPGWMQSHWRSCYFGFQY